MVLKNNKLKILQLLAASLLILFAAFVSATADRKNVSDTAPPTGQQGAASGEYSQDRQIQLEIDYDGKVKQFHAEEP